MIKSQDILILLKISELQQKKQKWEQKYLSSSLLLSGADISNGIKRCAESHLLDFSTKEVIIPNLLEVLIYGVRYFFPATLGAKTRGIPTAWGVAPLKNVIASSDLLPVWPYHNGEISGLTVNPIHKSVAEIAVKDPHMYALLALIDGLRIGKIREREQAKKELHKRLSI